eukprot:181563-Hanusia_phi.AAC.3
MILESDAARPRIMNFGKGPGRAGGEVLNDRTRTASPIVPELPPPGAAAGGALARRCGFKCPGIQYRTMPDSA